MEKELFLINFNTRKKIFIKSIRNTILMNVFTWFNFVKINCLKKFKLREIKVENFNKIVCRHLMRKTLKIIHWLLINKISGHQNFLRRLKLIGFMKDRKTQDKHLITCKDTEKFFQSFHRNLNNRLSLLKK